MAALRPLKTRLRADLAGQQFGRLTVVRALGTRHGKVRWLCNCSCGGVNIVATGSLRSGHIASCGCLYVESRGESMRTHGLSQTPEYRIWKGMIGRCENKARDFYARYGGRGIAVCAEWRQSFERFLADMGPRPSTKHTVERIDNESGYTPRNCRWATMVEQGQNTSKARRITFNGETMSMQAWSRKLKRSRLTIKLRADAGLPLDS